MKCWLTLLSVLFLTQSKAQFELERNLTPRLFELSGKEMEFPWAGGLNSVHPSEIDLNLDGIKDLFIYDLSGGRISTFINRGTADKVDYVYAPEYIDKFPKAMESFVQFIDYNNDGRNDLFTFFNIGIKVFKNISTPETGLKFQDVTNDANRPYLVSQYIPGPNGLSNLYLSRGDVPAISDIDNDGDLDILAFGNTAATVYFHENFAADSGNLEKFDFHVATSCWGNFEEDFNSELIILDISCKGGIEIPKNKRNKHAGSTLLALDVDGDGDKDLVVGDISSTRLTLLINGGDSTYADMIEQHVGFPQGTQAIDMSAFPAAHLLDVNNDGIKDLLVSPNTVGSVENATSLWYYENTGTNDLPVFVFRSDNLLQDNMIELGEGVYPAFFDHNGDSIPDLVLGNHGFYNDLQLSRSLLKLYQLNENGDYYIKDEDLAGISSLILNVNLGTPTLDVSPAFGDLDGDGDKDLLVGDFEGKLHYFENVAFPGQPARFELRETNYKEIDVGGYAAPQLFDLDGDNKLDLLIGERNGNINYYRNTGSFNAPDFELVTEELGGVDVVPPFNFNGYSYPFFFLSGNELKLLCGSQSGTIYYYDQIEPPFETPFRLVDSIFGNIREGLRSSVSGGDLNGDGKLDLVIGNYAGGAALYKSDLVYTNNDPDINISKPREDLYFDILPVPSLGIIELRSNMKGFGEAIFDVDIFNVQGSKIFSKKNTSSKSFDLRFLSKGIYYLQLQNGQEQVIKKFITL